MDPKSLIMEWKSFFYFTQGERRGLTLLTLLIVGGWILWTMTEPPTISEVVVPTEVPDSVEIVVDTGSRPVPLNRLDTSKPLRSTIVSSMVRDGHAIRSRIAQQRPSYPRVEKYPAGTVVELNGADSLQLKKIPGIGSTFARRIVKYRDLLGGYASVDQLGEVYGIDAERLEALRPWFRVDTAQLHRLSVNQATLRELVRHPYLSYEQAQVIVRLVQQKGRLQGWENLQLLEEFTESDQIRLLPYLSFE